MKDVFLSHAHADKPKYVRKFANALDVEGLSYWIDEAAIGWGDKISAKINDGLSKSTYVVVFLTKAFLGRQWPEAELSAALNRENSEGRTVVLPIVAGGKPEDLLSEYPLLRDKKFQVWGRDIQPIVEELKTLIYISREKPEIDASIKGSESKVSVSPDLTLKLLSELGSHSVYRASYIASELVKCGFLASVVDRGTRLVINGHFVEPCQPTTGEPGISSLDTSYVVFKLIVGTDHKSNYLGRGFNYQGLISELRSYMMQRGGRPETSPDVMGPR